jgi:D-erythronate 2-dehydrogenase
MRILVTGGAGFIGAALAARLRALPDAHIVAVDRADGDIADPAFVRGVVTPGTDVVFHLAGVVSGAAEADFALGMRVNLDGTRNVLDACRALPSPPRLVHASSIAVYGPPLPARIDDDTYPVPALSYGAQKLACEQLINDYSRRGFVDGCSLRLPGIIVRPPLANGALSAFNSDIIREPLAGRRITAPVSADATVWVLSLARCVENFVHAMRLDAARLGAQRAVLLPALAVSIREILDTLGAIAERDVWPLVTFAPDPEIEAKFGRWPRPFTAQRALALGFTRDADLATILGDYAAAT